MARINLSVGRQRVTRALDPSNAAYVRQMQRQMQGLMTNLATVIESIKEASPDALLYATQPIFDTSQALVPVDTGRLKRSGFHEARRTYRGATVAIGYARGGSPDYAAIVHERTELNHASPTQAKYLHEAVNRHTQHIVPRYAEYIKRDTGLS